MVEARSVNVKTTTTTTTFGRDGDQETVQITSNGWRAGITLDNFFLGGGVWLEGSQIVGNEGPICHFDFLQPKLLDRFRSYVDLPVEFEELSRLQLLLLLSSHMLFA